MPGSVLVTGGAGFIGSHIVEDLLRAGYRVTVFDNFSSGLRENLAAFDGEVEIVEGDILDAEALTAAARGKDALPTKRATRDYQVLGRPDRRYAHEPRWNDQRVECGEDRRCRARRQRIVGLHLRAGSRSAERRRCRPARPQLVVRRQQARRQKYAQIFSNDYGFAVYSLRYGITYGPNEWYGRVLTIFLKRLSEGKAPVVFGAGEQLRDFVFVDDVVRIHRACIESGLCGAQSFNGGTGIATSVSQLARLACDISHGPRARYGKRAAR